MNQLPLDRLILLPIQDGIRAGIEKIAPQLLGRDPRHVDRINDLMDQSLAWHLHATPP